MDDEKYARKVVLRCPTCGSDQFAFDPDDESSLVKCADCGRETTREEIIEDNGPAIESQLTEIGDEVVADLAKDLNRSLNDAFRGNSSIRFK